MSTRRTFILDFLALALALPPLLAFAQTHRRIPLAQLQAMFADMRAKTKWNIDGPLLWGYFFFDPSPEKLKQASANLEASGYRVVSLEKVANKQVFRLHVERVETHSPESLKARNDEFYAFAEKYSLASYDGMDVGPATTSAK